MKQTTIELEIPHWYTDNDVYIELYKYHTHMGVEYRKWARNYGYGEKHKTYTELSDKHNCLADFFKEKIRG